MNGLWKYFTAVAVVGGMIAGCVSAGAQTPASKTEPRDRRIITKNNTDVYDSAWKLRKYTDLLAHGNVPAITMSVWWRAAWMNLSDEEILNTANIGIETYYYDNAGKKVVMRRTHGAMENYDDNYIEWRNALAQLNHRLESLLENLDRANRQLKDYRGRLDTMIESGSDIPYAFTKEIEDSFLSAREEVYRSLTNLSKTEFSRLSGSQDIMTVTDKLYDGADPEQTPPHTRFRDEESQKSFVQINRNIIKAVGKYGKYVDAYRDLRLHNEQALKRWRK